MGKDFPKKVSNVRPDESGNMNVNGSEGVCSWGRGARELANSPGKAMVQSKGSGVEGTGIYSCRAGEWHRESGDAVRSTEAGEELRVHVPQGDISRLKTSHCV